LRNGKPELLLQSERASRVQWPHSFSLPWLRGI
jgi:hypothetical protein